MVDPPETVDEQDLVNMLLAGTVQATHTIAQLTAFAARHRGGEPGAQADVAAAIEAMVQARARLLGDVERLTGQPDTAAAQYRKTSPEQQ